MRSASRQLDYVPAGGIASSFFTSRSKVMRLDRGEKGQQIPTSPSLLRAGLRGACPRGSVSDRRAQDDKRVAQVDKETTHPSPGLAELLPLRII